ncbi:MAG TPA: family 20 glycosylhydrolase [Candidatus Rubrimentiphilum sp.]|nr:family 20 glycosylhydrolase [Candidatus Rubrimentiphilum sp.]
MIAAFMLAAIPSIVPWPRSVHAGANIRSWPGSPAVAQRILSPADKRLGDEGYTLSVTAQGVTAEANTRAGLFYAMQTFKQLRATSLAREMQIRDWPAYRWRGVHLDTARHFFDVATVERYIDVAARYKLNIFHWHLTDDQAWRLPVPGYPNLISGRPSYTAAQVREVVAYAARRFVTVLPEVEMPAHASAAIEAYPQFGCGRSDVFCARASTFAFLQDALAQTFDLFPDPYVHIGGDEVPAGYNEPAFISRIERYVRTRGRRIVGWNEILSPQLSTSAVVMAWNSMRRAADAARRGNDVVVSGWPLYFDAAQGDPMQEPRATRHVSTLDEVYSWDVVPPGLAGDQRARVVGGEAALWTERIRTPQHLFYMLLPRELALAEILWTPRAQKNWPNFLQRLPAQFAWLDAQGYPFRIPNASMSVEGDRTVFTALPGEIQSVDAWTTAARVKLALSTPIDATIRYTLDGKTPARSAPAYREPVILNLSPGARLDVRAAAFFGGRRGAVTECRIHRVGPGAMPRTNVARSWGALVSP